VSELAAGLGVSAVTIRADLDSLEARGLVKRSHGAAGLLRTPPPERDMRQKDALNSEAKDAIGAAAAALVQPGDNLLVDGGTTTMSLARRLRNIGRATVMTNGLNIALELADAPDVQVLLTGGLLRKQSLSLQGAQAEACLGLYNFDKLFLGADGLDPEYGLTTHDESEAGLNRKMVDRAKRVIVLADSSKFGRVSLHRIVPLDRVHAVVTDSGISAEHREALGRLNLELIIAN
jgi:DeoR family transcriptional regulator of aga operon